MSSGELCEFNQQGLEWSPASTIDSGAFQRLLEEYNNNINELLCLILGVIG